MARAPQSHYNKLFGGKGHGKGPASTKTLTTNTHTTTTGVSSVLHDPSVPRTYLFDIYKNEAESHFEIGEYRQAADCYNAAVKLQPHDTAAIIARSRCYAQMGRWKRAMKDCDAALTIDAGFAEALYQKAEILHINGNLDLAQVYFKRALKQQPDSIRYKNAVQRVTEAINKQSVASAHKGSKLTAVGDLSMFLQSRTKPRRGIQVKDTPRLDDDDKLELPSAGFRARFNVAPLIRINRKPGVSILRTYRPESAKSNSSVDSANREPDEATMRTILGELYGDRKYLKKFQNNLPGGKAERDLTLLADEGLDFLRERTLFWDSLGPLPPPQVPKRSNMRERSFFMTTNDTSPVRKDKFNRENTILKLPPVSENQNVTSSDNNASDSNDKKNFDQNGETGGKRKPGLLPRKAKKKKKLEVAMGLEKDYSDVDFKFRSLQPSRSASRLDEACPEPLPFLRETSRAKTRMGRTMFVGMDDPDRDRKRQLTKFINNEMDVIDEAFKSGEFEDCRNKANVCLRTVASLPGDDINKSEVVASLHSCIGNACIAMNDFDGALRHHMEALAIGETEDLIEVVNRSLGHLGRMYIIQKRFNKALEVFARKAPAVSSAEEIAQVFHEIGNCFLALGHLDYARDCGKKALRAALEADIHYFKFQSWVLIAVSESRMKHHDEAYKAFDAALKLAKDKDDEESVNVILFAMEHLSKTITSIMKKRAMLSERLMCRSTTQTILDLNKRPHAAKMKKRKKRLRREETDIDASGLTRQGTYVQGNELEKETIDAKGVDNEGGDGDAGLRPEYTRGASMFEKNPRELEPFGDPSVRNKKKQEKQEKRTSVRIQSRHGVLDRLGSGSRRGSWADDQQQSRRGSIEDTRLVIPPTPQPIESTGVDASTSPMIFASPRNVDSDRHRNSESVDGLPPLKRTTGSAVPDDDNTPRPDKSHDELTAAKGDHTRHMTSMESISYEDGFLSQREEYFSKSRTGRHQIHGGGFHSNRESRADFNDDTKHQGKVTPRDGRDSTQRMVGAKSRSLSRTKRAGRLDASVEESVAGKGEEGDDTVGDVTGGSSAINSNWHGDMSSGRMGDLSVTMESSFRTHAVEDDLTPRQGEDRIGEGDGGSKETSPRRQERRISNTADEKRLSVDTATHGKTPGRFTRESYFDENEVNAGMNETYGGQSPEHVSVSRQHYMSRRAQKGQPESKSQAVEAEVETPRREKNEQRSHGDNGSRQVTRASSRVSLRGAKNEETMVTLATSKPYRVSSATSERNVRSGQRSPQGSAKKDHVDGNEIKRHDQRNADADDADVDLTPRHEAKSQVSDVTTGSGWDGDVSTETEVMQTENKKGKSKKLKPSTEEGHRGRNQKLVQKHDENVSGKAEENYDLVGSKKNMKLETISKTPLVMSSNDDVTLPEVITEGSTVTSLRPKEVQEEVLKNTEEAPTEEKRLVYSSKVAYLDQKHATKVWREARDLEDIQSVQNSSRADLGKTGNAEAKSFRLESDPDKSVTLPVSSVVSSNVSVERTSARFRDASPGGKATDGEDGEADTGGRSM